MKYIASVVLFVLLVVFSARSQSLMPCDLICATTEISGDVTLEWIESPETCGPFVEYIIYASNNISGPYAILDFVFTETTTTYVHTGASGTSTTWYYFIEVLFDCPGLTTTNSDTLDNLDPAAPVLDYVSVSTGGVDISWEPSVSAKTSGYTIYRDMGGFVAVGTVDGRYTTTFFDNTASAGSQVETYTVASNDDCGNTGPFSVNPHHTILMNATQVACSDMMEITWNHYDTWPEGVLEYQVWLDLNGTGNTLIASVPPTENTYLYTGLTDSDVFNFTIVAVSADLAVTSVSNAWNFNLNVVDAAKYNIIRNASVTGSNSVEVSWYPDGGADLLQYEIQRSDNGVSYAVIQSDMIINPAASPDTYTDNTAETGEKSYYYKTVTTDSCGEMFSSGIVRTMLLTGTGNDNFTNQLTWNAFEMTNATITGYDVYRITPDAETLLVTLDASVLSYLDDVAPIITLTDSACYYVDANYLLNTTAPAISESLISRSNKVCYAQESKIFVPNAIVPGSANGVFKPVIVFSENTGYNMKIFNRYGEVIFESIDVNLGWDGTYKGETVPVGSYGYVITYLSTDGTLMEKKGNVTVIH